MKIAITAQGDQLDSPVDPRFGRAKLFVIYDIDTDGFEVIDNIQNLQAAQGAGIQSAQRVADQDVEFVLTGHCGPKAFRALTQSGIKIIVGLSGTVQEAVDQFKAGALEAADGADVDGHWM